MIFIIAGTGMIKGDDFANSSVSSASSVHGRYTQVKGEENMSP